MNDRQLQQFISYAVMAVITYYLLQMIVPYLFIAVIAMLIWRVFQNHKHRK